MPKKVDLRKILKINQQVDGEELRKSLQLGEELRKNGVHRSYYRLAPPFARKHPVIIDIHLANQRDQENKKD